MKSLIAFAAIVIASIGCSKKDPAPSNDNAVVAAKPVPSPEPTEPTAPTAPTTAPATAPTAEPTAMTLPKEAQIAQGEEAWAVYFAVGAVDAAEFVAAKARTAAMGLTIEHKDRSCDVTADSSDATEAMVLAAYYSTEADANAVAAAFGTPAPWVGKVKTMCLD